MKNLLNKSVDQIKYKALYALADAYPNSFVVDMLTYFDEKTELFGYASAKAYNALYLI